MARYDWTEIEDAYVQGRDDVTLETLRKKYGCSWSAIKDHSRKDDWKDKRRQFRARVQEKSQDRASTTIAEMRVRHLNASKLMMGKALTRIIAIEPDELTPAAARMLLRDGADIERKALGIEEGVDDFSGMSPEDRIMRLADLVKKAREKAKGESDG